MQAHLKKEKVRGAPHPLVSTGAECGQHHPAIRLSNLLAGLKVICCFTISHQALLETGAAVPFLLGNKCCMVLTVLSSPSPLAMGSLKPWEFASGPCEPQETCQSSPLPNTAMTFNTPQRNNPCLSQHTEGRISSKRRASSSN